MSGEGEKAGGKGKLRKGKGIGEQEEGGERRRGSPLLPPPPTARLHPSHASRPSQGAELDILDAMHDWQGVEKLVVEYSFTKRRSLAAFRSTVERLRRHFKTVECPQLVDDPELLEWTGHRDALLFASVE